MTLAHGGPGATTDTFAPLDGAAVGTQTAKRPVLAPEPAAPSQDTRKGANVAQAAESGRKKLQTFGKAALEMEYPDAWAVWQASPGMARGRSSTMDFLKAWREQLKIGIPPVAEILDSLEAWKRSKKWAENGGEYIEGIHRWINRRQWENRPMSSMEMTEEQTSEAMRRFA